MSRRGFTLIELLVVTSIIGLLSSVITASLNTARYKGKEVTIRTNLENMIPQAELTYINSIPNSYSTVCTAVAGMITAIANAGATASCSTYDGTRWGASARLNTDSTKNWAVGSGGVVTWDTVDTTNNINQASSTAVCMASGGRLPSIEELQALYTAYGTTPPGMIGDYYWSSTPHETLAGNGYMFHFGFGAVVYSAVTTQKRARCVH